MIQVVELRQVSISKEVNGNSIVNSQHRLEYELGKGQEIENVMAGEVGVKVFRILEPAYVSRGKIRYPEAFDQVHIDDLVKVITDFLKGDRSDGTTQEIKCTIPTNLS